MGDNSELQSQELKMSSLPSIDYSPIITDKRGRVRTSGVHTITEKQPDNNLPNQNREPESHKAFPHPTRKVSLRRRHSRRNNDQGEDRISKLLVDLTSAVKENNRLLKNVIHQQPFCANTSDSFEKPKINREDKVTVEIRVGYKKIVDVDTVRQVYKAEIFIQSRWQEPLLAKYTDKDLSLLDYESLWKPQIEVLNCIEEEGMKVSSQFSINLKEPGYKFPIVLMYQDIKGVFTETLELEDFPFDVQELTLQVTSKRPMCDVELKPDRNELSVTDINSCLDQDEWTLYQHVEYHKRIRREILPDQKEVLKSSIDFTCSARRNPGYYVWNIIFIMFIVTTLKFTAYSEAPKKFQARLVITFTLLLTCIAFKSTIKQSLPPISYLTYLDIYILLSIALLAGQAVQMAIMATLIYDEALVLRVDQYCLYVLASIHLMLQILFFGMMAIMHYKRISEMNKKDQEYLRQKSHLDQAATLFNSSKSTRKSKNSSKRHSVSIAATSTTQPSDNVYVGLGINMAM